MKQELNFFNIIYGNLRLQRINIRHRISCQAELHESVVLLGMPTFSYIGCTAHIHVYPIKRRVSENQFNRNAAITDAVVF